MPREVILKCYLKSEIVVSDGDKMVQESSSRQVPMLCETRWSARVATLSSVMAKYHAMSFAFAFASREISHWRVQMQKQEQKLSCFSSAGFIVLVVAQFILSFSHPLCQALQRTVI